MLSEQQLTGDVLAGKEFAEQARQKILLKQLLANPERQRHPKRLKTDWRKREVGIEQSFELQERFVVEGDKVHAFPLGVRRLETEADRMLRKPRVVLFPGEPLLLRRSNQASVLDDRRG